jgi:spore germination protein
VTGPSGETVHTVAAGDTLVRIARQYNVTVQAIVSANNLQNPNVLAVGQQLVIPTPEP